MHRDCKLTNQQKWKKSNASCIIHIYKLKWKISVFIFDIYQQTMAYTETKLLWLLFLYFTYHILFGNLYTFYSDWTLLNLSTSKQLQLYAFNAKLASPKYTMDKWNELSYLQTETNVVIAGMIRNGENTLSDLLNQVQLFACAFHSAHVVIFESNSADSTPQILKNWLKTGINFNKDTNESFIITADKICEEYNANQMIHLTLLQPTQELNSVLKLYQKYRKSRIKHYQTENNGKLNSEDLRIGKYVQYRNWILQYIEQTYQMNIDYLIWIDFDLVGFNVQRYLTEFMHMLQHKNKQYYHVLCGNSVKYNGWYYDTYSTVFTHDNATHWAYLSHHRAAVANVINSKRFTQMKSCFGGVAFYDYKFLIKSKCKYMQIVDALDQLKSFEQWFSAYHLELHEICEHIAMNFCLSEKGANIALSSQSNVFYGTHNKHGISNSDSDSDYN